MNQTRPEKLMHILVTGGTGTLGRLVVERLRAASHSVSVLSRRTGPGLITGDLLRNTGLEAAVGGVDVIVHCATGSNDVRATTNLVNAAVWSGSPHIVYISIVGVDRIPFVYYRQKYRAEAVISESSLPFTILRATQFHNLVASIFDAQRWSPVLVVPTISVQPVEVSEVADVLAGLATSPPAGRVPDFGGPEKRQLSEFARDWEQMTGRSRKHLPLRVPGAAFRAFRQGLHTTPENTKGVGTFTRFLETRRAGTAL
ncbi:SDR family oxidoreductase [Mycetocola zhadangensis]|uniref:SDR family oxidoreductase n=1 Tax=Mycetocola zhadangensis TaxID=1164595 RepID=UPI003A4D2559